MAGSDLHVNTRTKDGKTWGMLSLSSLGFIGKLFRNSHLQQLATFFMMFYDEKPVDWLIYNFLDTKDLTVFVSDRHVFHHIGRQSSLHGKEQHVVDYDFPRLYALREEKSRSTKKPLSEKPKPINPPAVFYSTMGDNQYYSPDALYNTPHGLYWAEAANKSAYFTVSFRHYQVLHNIRIETGTKEHPGDILHHASLVAGLKTRLKGKSVPQQRIACTNDVHLGTFVNGRVEVRVNNTDAVACVSVIVEQAQDEWVIFNIFNINSTDTGRSTSGRKGNRAPPEDEAVKRVLRDQQQRLR